MSDWQQIGENLVRHKGGGIYLRAKVGGKIKRISLDTKDLRIAKLKRDEAVANLRKAAASAPQAGGLKTLGQAIDAYSKIVLNQVDLEEASIRYYREVFRIMNETLNRQKIIRSWTREEAAEWWRKIAKNYAAQRANNILGMAKRITKYLIEAGALIADPTRDLKRKKILETQIYSPSQQEMDVIIENIRSQKKARSDQSADFVAFIAYSGCRLGQAKALCWKDIHEDWVVFRSGVSGTKGAATRRLPISSRLREVLDRLSARRSEHTSDDDFVFSIQNPHEALTSACVRVGIPHLRIHDLRHFFASWAMECGIDVRLLAQWLGHKDNGVLLLRRYAHVRDEHNLASAAKLK